MAVASPFADLLQSRRGILWVLATTLSFVAMDAIAKYLGRSYPVPEIVWARYTFHALLLVVLLRGRLTALMRTRRIGLQLARSALLFCATVLGFHAVRLMPLADVAVIWSMTPILVTALSVPVLGESVGGRRWAGVAAGFVGALIIIRPGLGVTQAVVLLPVVGSFALAFYHLSTRSLSRTDASLTTLIYTGLVGLVASTLAVPFFWVPPDPPAWGLMVALGAFGGLGHFTLIKALKAAPAATIMPYTYTSLVWAAVVGLLVFGDLPDLPTVIGALIIAASGIYIYRREHWRRDVGMGGGGR